MKCPICAHADHRVVRTDAKDGRVRRSRECLKCAHRWFTIEILEDEFKRLDAVKSAYLALVLAVANAPEGPIGPRLASRPTSLYRHFDASGRLLYVGVAVCVKARTKTHKLCSPWFGEVVHTQVCTFPTRAEALDAERVAIQFEHPACNKRGRVKC